MRSLPSRNWRQGTLSIVRGRQLDTKTGTSTGESMSNLKVWGLLLFAILSLSACQHELTPEQKQLDADLKEELAGVRLDVQEAEKQNAEYSGGLIKSLIAMRLEVLKTNEALVQQRISALESGARIMLTVNGTTPDPARAAAIEREIEAQKVKLAEAQVEADRYSGGLVRGVAETSVATIRTTLALLDQQYLIVHYGIATPISVSSGRDSEKSESSASEQTTRTADSAGENQSNRDEKCLKVKTFDSSVLSTNDVYTELAWKVDVSNSCDQSIGVRITFTIYDKDEFELDSDSKEIDVPANGVAKARGKMLVSPPEKARRMAREGASVVVL
jgi:hypothetical protein